MNLNDVHSGIHTFKKRRRVGRGTGSGRGKTSGRGHKGHRARSGYSRHPTFQGGAMPLVRRVPKRGFNNPFAAAVAVINVSELEKAYQSGDEVTPETLRAKSLAKQRYDVLKVLGDGELTKSLKVTAHRFSQSAREKIEKAGGQAIELPAKKPVVRNKQKSARRS